MAKNTQRTDEHRPGAIIPANYIDWNSYSLARDMVPAIGVDCSLPYTTYDHEGRATGTVQPVCNDTGRCCVRSAHKHARAEGRAIFGGTGKCGVCGAHFAYGTMFKHEPTGAIVHMGHDCADKYSAMYDLSAWELQNNRARAAVAKAIQRAENDAERAAFLAQHVGLEADLALGNYDGRRSERLLADLASKFATYRSMSDKQIAFAHKLAEEIRNPPAPKAEEIKVAAPVGKGVEFEGEIVSIKLQTSEQYGSTWKCTIKVATDAGVWLAWGTLPSSMTELCYNANKYGDALKTELKGMRVSVKATLEGSVDRECSRCCDWFDAHDRANCGTCKGTRVIKGDKSFVFMKRPTMCPAGLVLHPQYKVPKVKKSKPAPEVTE